MTPSRSRSRSIGKAVRAISKTLARRTGEAKAQVMAFNEQAGRLIARSAREAKRLAAAARRVGPGSRREGEAAGRRRNWRSSQSAAGRWPSRSTVASAG